MVPSLDTSDATATADYIVDGYTAYVNGEKITGTIKRNYGSISKDVTPQAGGGGFPAVVMDYQFTEPIFMDPNFGAYVTLYALFEAFGNAEAADVTEGKTFTSAAGLLVTGTKVVSSGVETVSGNLQPSAPADATEIFGTIYYLDGNGELQIANTNDTITVMKNTLIFVISNGSGEPQQYSGNIEVVYNGDGTTHNQGYMLYRVTGDFELTI